MADELQPAVFFGHGNPMNAIEHNRYTEAWHAFGAGIPRPRGIVMVSAHWYLAGLAAAAGHPAEAWTGTPTARSP